MHTFPQRLRALVSLLVPLALSFLLSGCLASPEESEIGAGEIESVEQALFECGDGVCSTGGRFAESTATCPEDCGSLCGDGVCTYGEDTFNCDSDCCTEGCFEGNASNQYQYHGPYDTYRECRFNYETGGQYAVYHQCNAALGCADYFNGTCY